MLGFEPRSGRPHSSSAASRMPCRSDAQCRVLAPVTAGQEPEGGCGGGAGSPTAGRVRGPRSPAGPGVTGGSGRKTEDPPAVTAHLIRPRGSEKQSWEQLLAPRVQGRRQDFTGLPLLAEGVPKSGTRAECVSTSNRSRLGEQGGRQHYASPGTPEVFRGRHPPRLAPAAPLFLGLCPAASWLGRGESG